jgi:hypothetical protein
MKKIKQTINKKRVDKLFNSLINEDLIEDRVEYDEEDLQLAYPKLNKKEVKLLYLKIQQWKCSKLKKKRPSKVKIVKEID